MKKSNIHISRSLLDAIANAKISEQEKLYCFRYVGYLTVGEQSQLFQTL